MRSLAMVLVVAAGCATTGSGKNAGSDEDTEDFRCLDRRATYVMAGGFVAPEYGLSASCNEGPRLLKWTVDDQGNREESTHVLSVADFEELWRNLEDAGWKNLEDCDNPNAKDDDQVYTFEVSDGDKTVGFMCQGKELPFPYDRIVNAFDLMAGQFN